jgi:hypothetical protein
MCDEQILSQPALIAPTPKHDTVEAASQATGEFVSCLDATARTRRLGCIGKTAAPGNGSA